MGSDDIDQALLAGRRLRAPPARFARSASATNRDRVSVVRSLFLAALGAMALLTPPAAYAGAGLDLGPYKGKVVYLDFWASWCVPCRQSFPWMQEVQATYARQGFVVIAVNVDHDRGAAEQFLQAHGANFKLIFDPNGDIAAKYKISGMPMSVLIDRDGRVRFSHVGFYESKEDTYVSQIHQLVSERAP